MSGIFSPTLLFRVARISPRRDRILNQCGCNRKPAAIKVKSRSKGQDEFGGEFLMLLRPLCFTFLRGYTPAELVGPKGREYP